jgi:hypothetical protein
MTTKYIVNNVSGQTINGDITINGNLVVTGTTTNIGFVNYSALLTQTEQITGTSITDFNYSLIIGEEYTITNYVSGDSFSNVAQVTSGNINETDCVFIATGSTPSIWSNGSELVSSGDLVVDVLENTLGFDLTWDMNPGPGSGVYFVYNDITGPTYNTFERDKTSVITQLTFYPAPVSLISVYAQPGFLVTKDDIVYVLVTDLDSGQPTDNRLYYTPVEIKIKRDTNTTPIVVSGTVESSYSFNNVSVELKCDGSFIEDFIGDGTTVNDITELIAQLNTNEVTAFLGTYSDAGDGGVLLSIATNKANQFCSTGTLSFEVYSD